MFVHILKLKVLSESVPKGLTLLGGENVSATAHFVAIFDKFFDCFNVSNFDNGKLKINVNLFRHHTVHQKTFDLRLYS